MNKREEFINEISGYSIEELELIYETQKDLYSEEEMELIKQQIEQYEREEQEKIEKMLPKEIICSKCDGPNPFENNECVFCGAKLDKAKYYDLEYYEKQEETQDSDSESNAFRYIISFLIPLVGYILGAILLSKDDVDEKSAGQSCIILGIVSTVLSVIIWFAYVNAMF